MGDIYSLIIVLAMFHEENYVYSSSTRTGIELGTISVSPTEAELDSFVRWVRSVLHTIRILEKPKDQACRLEDQMTPRPFTERRHQDTSCTDKPYHGWHPQKEGDLWENIWWILNTYSLYWENMYWHTSYTHFSDFTSIMRTVQGHTYTIIGEHMSRTGHEP